jgi:addiction module RelE/StbE family toxin
VHEVELTQRVQRAIRKLDKPLQKMFREKIAQIAEDPYTAEPLTQDLKGWWSFHFTRRRVDYRIIYWIYRKEKLVLVGLAGSRENIYKELRKMK